MRKDIDKLSIASRGYCSILKLLQQSALRKTGAANGYQRIRITVV